MIISVIIPTYNSANKIENLLKAIKKQTIQIAEILVIDSSSTDETIRIASSYGAKTLIIDKNNFDHGGTRSYAAKIAKGDILIYLTDDALPENEKCFENILSCFADINIAAVFGRQIPYHNTNIFGKHLRYFNYPEESYIRSFEDRKKYGIKTPFLSNSFCAYRKSILEKVNFFKDNLILGEDTYIGAKILKAGYKIAYCAEAVVYHSHNYSAFEEFKRYFDIGVFHQCENWILTEFGKAEGEGKKYVLSGIKYLWDEKKIYYLPEFFLRIFLKYLGYKLGRNYKILPKFIIKFLTMHKSWWEK